MVTSGGVPIIGALVVGRHIDLCGVRMIDYRLALMANSLIIVVKFMKWYDCLPSRLLPSTVFSIRNWPLVTFFILSGNKNNTCSSRFLSLLISFIWHQRGWVLLWDNMIPGFNCSCFALQDSSVLGRVRVGVALGWLCWFFVFTFIEGNFFLFMTCAN